MVLPGYNVTEPIDLAIKLYKVVDSLRGAPEGAQAFVSKVKNFSGNLESLHRILEKDTASHSTQDLDHLRATIVDCQACVKRCEEYSEGFQKLTKDGRGKMDGVGQAARWVLQEKKVRRLREDIDTQMSGIGLTLVIQNLCAGFSSSTLHVLRTKTDEQKWSKARLPFGTGGFQSSCPIRNRLQLTSILFYTAQVDTDRRSSASEGSGRPFKTR